MPHSKPRRESVPPDLLDTNNLLTEITGGPGPRLLADRALPQLADATDQELCDAGLAPAAARRLTCALELGRRLHSAPLRPGAQLKTAEQVFSAYDSQLRHLKKERFISVLLDARSRVIRDTLVTVGILTASLVHPREVFAPAIRYAAASLVLVHNHPSLDPEPSPEDIEITRRLVTVGELVGIRISDHIVIGGGRYVSLMERGLIVT